MTLLASLETGTTTQLLRGSAWEAGAYQGALALKDLPEDWDRPRSQRPTVQAINAALQYLECVAGLGVFILEAPFIAPMPDGGVQIEWDHGERHLEIELQADGSARFLVSLGGRVEEGELGSSLTPFDVRILIRWLTDTL